LDSNLTLRRLVPSDLAAALSLSQDAGWNQVPEDWRLLLDLGEGYGLFSGTEALVGTACLLPYPPCMAWISMLIVRKGWRGRGLGSCLLTHVLRVLDACGLTPSLDATPLGRPLYLRFGFRDLWGFQRYVAAAPQRGTERISPEVAIRPMESRDMEEVAALDALVFGARRHALLERLRARLPEAALVAMGQIGLRGALLGRDGRLATQLGPLVSMDVGAGAALIRTAMDRAPVPLQVDVPDAQVRLSAFLLRQGFEAKRSFSRMILGSAPAPGDVPTLRAIAGAELG